MTNFLTKLGFEKGVKGTAQIGNVISTGVQAFGEATGIQQDSKAAKAFKAIGSAASLIPGPVGMIASAASNILGSTIGGGGYVDELGNKQDPSGITKLLGWGRSELSLNQESNRKKNSLLAQEQTANMQAEFANNNPNVEPQPAALAAEGGIMRRPVDALVSKGELIYNPVTKKLNQVPGSKGKPNRQDNVYAKLYEGDIVISNSPTMLMANGKTPAQNLVGLVDKYATGGTVKAREAIIKKVVNWQEANKTKPQQYAMYDEGNIVKYGYDKNMDNFAYWDKDKKEYKKEYLDWVNGLTDQDVKDIFSGKYGDMSTYKSVNKDYVPTLDEAKRLMTDKKYGDWHKIGAAVKEKMYTLPEDVVEEYEPDVPLQRVQIKSKDWFPELFEPILPITEPKKKGINLGNIGDRLYEAASILTPTLDRENADPVKYQVPVAKYRPTGINVDPSLRAINDVYAQARYNQQNISTNTGAGMAYGLQAAMNRGKQMADVYAWQQNAQNELIGKNVDTYNQWSRDYSNIMNDVYDKTAANVAAARNINRQNKATALNNWGQIRKDAKQYEMDKLKIAAASPMWKYGMENYDELMKMLNS